MSSGFRPFELYFTQFSHTFWLHPSNSGLPHGVSARNLRVRNMVRIMWLCRSLIRKYHIYLQLVIMCITKLPRFTNKSCIFYSPSTPHIHPSIHDIFLEPCRHDVMFGWKVAWINLQQKWNFYCSDNSFDFKLPSHKFSGWVSFGQLLHQPHKQSEKRWDHFWNIGALPLQGVHCGMLFRFCSWL